MNWRTHAISFVILIFAVGILKFVWDNPKVIVYLILFAIGVLAYGAVYIVVKTKMDSTGKK